MNLLFIGNGFDLNYNLPTTYANFLHTVSFIRDHYESSMNSVGSVFGDKRLSDIDNGIKQSDNKYHSEYESVSLDETKMIELQEKAKSNKWFRYFCNHYNKDVGWIDFEKEIGKVIDELSYFFSTEESEDHSARRDKVNYTGYMRFLWLIMEAFGFAGSSIGSNAVHGRVYDTIVLRDDLYYEEPLKSGQMYIYKERITDELFSELKDLAEILSIYLHCFIEEPVQYFISTGRIELCPVFSSVDRVITFNYTNTYEMLCPAKTIYHIHGLLGSSLVLGVNADEHDELNNMDTTFIKFKKYYQRAIFETEAEYLKMINDIKSLKSKMEFETTLIVMGHSLDITDRDIITEVFSIADNIKIYYHDKEAHGRYIENIVKIFGKNDYDSMRRTKGLSFIPLESE